MIASLLLAAAASALDCGVLAPQQSGGDYLNPADADKLKVVEAFHFTPDVEALRRGSSGSIAGDLAYTLEHFPNHHRALAALARLAGRQHTAHPAGARYSVECYFERALRFNSGDTQARKLYAGWLLSAQRQDEALDQLARVTEATPNDAAAQYNLGLLLLKRKDFAGAREHAHKAYALAFPFPGLRQQLQRAGQWTAEDDAASRPPAP
ncbi:MAG: ABC transporter permease [Telluria sp.]